MTKELIDLLLGRVRAWPSEDQEELAEFARDIAARRSGTVRATTDELRAIDQADSSGVASDAEVKAALAKGEADVAAGRVTTLENDEDIDALFESL